MGNNGSEPRSKYTCAADQSSPEERATARHRGRNAPPILGDIEEGAAFMALAQGSRIANGTHECRTAPSLPSPGGAASASTETTK